jgi:hypothetical protein
MGPSEFFGAFQSRLSEFLGMFQYGPQTLRQAFTHSKKALDASHMKFAVRAQLELVLGYTVLVLDTNILLSSLSMVTSLVESIHWTVELCFKHPMRHTPAGFLTRVRMASFDGRLVLSCDRTADI